MNNQELLYELLNEYKELREIYITLKNNKLSLQEKKEEFKYIKRKNILNYKNS
jgi:hypothetical protein